MLYLCKQKQGHKGGPGATGPAAGRAGVLTYRRRSPCGRGLKLAMGPAGHGREIATRIRNRQNAKICDFIIYFLALHPVPRPAQQDRDLRKGSNIINQKIRSHEKF